MSHTPGPWKIEKEGYPKTLYIVSGEGDQEIVVVELYDQDTIQEEEANARLIAAAPELLEALLGLFMDRVDYWGSPPTDLGNGPQKVIEKATGTVMHWDKEKYELTWREKDE